MIRLDPSPPFSGASCLALLTFAMDVLQIGPMLGRTQWSLALPQCSITVRLSMVLKGEGILWDPRPLDSFMNRLV